MGSCLLCYMHSSTGSQESICMYLFISICFRPRCLVYVKYLTAVQLQFRNKSFCFFFLDHIQFCVIIGRPHGLSSPKKSTTTLLILFFIHFFWKEIDIVCFEYIHSSYQIQTLANDYVVNFVLKCANFYIHDIFCTWTAIIISACYLLTQSNQLVAEIRF